MQKIDHLLQVQTTSSNGSFQLQTWQEQSEYKERLIRNFIEYVRRTGDFSHPVLDDIIEAVYAAAPTSGDTSLQPQTLNNTSSILGEVKQELPVITLTSKTLDITRSILEEVKQELPVITLTMKEILKILVEGLMANNPQQLLRNLIEEIPYHIPDVSVEPALKAQHQKLALHIDRLNHLARKYGEIESSEQAGRSLKKLVHDLNYFRFYIEQHAQITKIQQEIYWVHDPSLYLRRLNQYLDILPETAIAIVNLLQNAIDSKLS